MSSSDKDQVQTDIKLEDGVTIVQENVTDIQNYLDTFNKEIQGGEQVVQQVGVVTADDGGAEEGTYYVDQAGQYYYQSPGCDGQQVMTVVSGIPGASTENEDGFVALPTSAAAAQRDDVSNSTPLLLPGGSGGQSVGGGGATEGGGGATSTTATYQTVTIVPSETNPGELSYLLIVQQPGEDDEGEGVDGQVQSKDKDDDDDHDLTVYDFDDAEDVGAVSGMESGEEDDKSKIVKFMPKKSQTVTQAHMCNYCNYTSPKRYLLSRHMKSHSEERPHKCSVCERGFKTLASLQNHVNTHTGTKPHRCKHCDSAFTTSGELVRHIRYKHTHEKPHKCTICDYASVELSKMRNHMRCHTGERPYQVASKAQLNSSSSSRKRSLAWDYFKEIDAKSAKCLLCSRVIKHYNGTRNLLVHVRRVHLESKATTAAAGEGKGGEERVQGDLEVGTNVELETVEISSHPVSSSVMNYGSETSAGLGKGPGVEMLSHSISTVVDYDAQTSVVLEDGPGVEISALPVSIVDDYEAQISAESSVMDYETQTSAGLENGSGVEVLSHPVSTVNDYDGQTSAELENGSGVAISSQPVPIVNDYDYDVQTSVVLKSGSGVDVLSHPVSTVNKYEAQMSSELENGSGVEILSHPVSSVIDYEAVIVQSTSELQSVSKAGIPSHPVLTVTDCGVGASAKLQRATISSHTESAVMDYDTQPAAELENISGNEISSHFVSTVPDSTVSTPADLQRAVSKSAILLRSVDTVIDENERVQFTAVIQGTASKAAISPHSVSPVIDYEAPPTAELESVSNVIISSNSVTPGLDDGFIAVQTPSELESRVLSHPVSQVVDYEGASIPCSGKPGLDYGTTTVETSSGLESGVLSHPVSQVDDYEVTTELETVSKVDIMSQPSELEVTAGISPHFVVDSAKRNTSDLAEEFPLQKLQIVLLFFEQIDFVSAVCTVCHKSIAHKRCLKPVLHHLLRSHRRAVSDAMLDQASCVAKLNSVYKNLQEAVTIVLTVFEKDLELWSCETMHKKAWKYFYRINKLVAMCLLCFCDFKVSRTDDKLVKHLRRCHPSVTVEDEEGCEKVSNKQRKCKVISDEVGNVWAYFVKKNDRIALCTLCPSNVHFLNSKTILSNHLRVKHGVLCSNTSEEKVAELLKDSEDTSPEVERLSKSSPVEGLSKSPEVIVENYDSRKSLKVAEVPSNKRHSAVWSHFKEVNSRVANCLVCKKNVKSFGSTGALLRHLRKFHGDIVEENNLQLKQPRSKSQRSFVWKYFTKKCPSSSVCSLCKRVVRGGNTGNLIDHLRRRHREEVVLEGLWLKSGGGKNKKKKEVVRKKKGRKPSIVWLYFIVKDDVTASCSLCKRCIKHYKTTKNLLEHLRRIHPQTLKFVGGSGAGDETAGSEIGSELPFIETVTDDDFQLSTAEVLPSCSATSVRDNRANDARTVVDKCSSYISKYFIKFQDNKYLCKICQNCIENVENLVKLSDHLSSVHKDMFDEGWAAAELDCVDDVSNSTCASSAVLNSELNTILETLEKSTDKNEERSSFDVKSTSKQQSIVLKSFSKKDETTVTCLFCNEDIEKFCSITNLLDHLESKHPDYQLVDSLTIPFTTTSDAVANSQELVEINNGMFLEKDKQMVEISGSMFVEKNNQQLVEINDTMFVEKDKQLVEINDSMSVEKINQQINDGVFVEKDKQLIEISGSMFAEKNNQQLAEMGNGMFLEKVKQQLVEINDSMFVEKDKQLVEINDRMFVEKTNQQLVEINDGLSVEKNILNSFDCVTDQQLGLSKENDVFVGKQTNYIVTKDVVLGGKQLGIDENGEVFIEKEQNSFNSDVIAATDKELELNENQGNSFSTRVSGKKLGINENGEIFIEKESNAFNPSNADQQFELNENREVYVEKESNSFSTKDALFSGKQLGINENGEIFIEKQTINNFETIDDQQLEFNATDLKEAENGSFRTRDVVLGGKQLGVNENSETFIEESSSNLRDVIIGGKQINENCVEKSSNSFSRSGAVDSNSINTKGVIIIDQELNFSGNGEEFHEKDPHFVEKQNICVFDGRDMTNCGFLVDDDDNNRLCGDVEPGCSSLVENLGDSELISMPNMDIDLEGIADDLLANMPGQIEMSVMTGGENHLNLVDGCRGTTASLTFEYQTKDDIRSLCSLICNCDVWSGNSGDIVTHMKQTHGVILKHSGTAQVETKLKKEHKKRSVVWSHFVVKDEKTATCQRCGYDFSRSSPRNLLAHLRNKHFIGCTSNMNKNSKGSVVKRSSTIRKTSVVWKYFKNSGSGYVCVLCDERNNCKLFSSVLNMRNHLRQLHGIVFKKRPKRFSYVWKYFKVVEDVQVCLLCEKELKSSDVRVLKNHLKNCHQDVISNDGVLDSVEEVVPVENVGEPSVAVIEDKNIEQVVQPVFDLDFKRHKRKRSKVWNYFTDVNATTCACVLCSAHIRHALTTKNLIEHMRRVHPGVLSEDTLYKRTKNAKKTSAVWKYFRKDVVDAVCTICGARVRHNRTNKKLASHLRKFHHEAFVRDVKNRGGKVVENSYVVMDVKNREVVYGINSVATNVARDVKKKGKVDAVENIVKDVKNSKVKVGNSLGTNTPIRSLLCSTKSDIINISHAKLSKRERKRKDGHVGSAVVAGNCSGVQQRGVELKFAENYGIDPELLKFPLKSCYVRLERCINDGDCVPK